MMKLNLGCGQNKLAGFVNVDLEEAAQPDVRCDLTLPPWPFENDSVEEVVANHVLEHIGPGPREFLDFMYQLWRVCAPNALVRIAVPHPRHDHFLGDPTHVRPITKEVLSLFSRTNCERWKAQGSANTPLALYLGVDFEIVEQKVTLEEKFKLGYDNGTYSAVQIDEFMRERCNVARELRFVLKAVK